MNDRAVAMSDAAEWFAAATGRWQNWTVAELSAAKSEQRVAAVIPARDEGATISDIVAVIRDRLVDRTGLVDELIVIDSDSRDDTALLAKQAGADVYAAAEIRADLGRHPGKGEALWKSQFVTDADLLVFIDADLTEWGPHFITGLLGPLLTDPGTALVKGFYDRLMDDGSGRVATQGGRVTELVARPLVNLHWPELSRVIQPLAGEWAIRRSVFETLPVPVGYGVEMATLLDVYATLGLRAIAQVDLGERAHSHQSVHDLGLMAAEIMAVVARRLGFADPPADCLWQFERAVEPSWRPRTVPTTERPPAADGRTEAGTSLRMSAGVNRTRRRPESPSEMDTYERDGIDEPVAPNRCRLDE